MENTAIDCSSDISSTLAENEIILPVKPQTQLERRAAKNTYAKRLGEIYLLMSPSEKPYIGQTIQTSKERWDQHQVEAFDIKKEDKCRALNAAIRLYGKDSFTLTILWRGEIGDDNVHINRKECEFIELYDSMAPNGYNLRAGGNGAMSAEAIQRMIEGNIVKTINKKRYQSDEQLPKYVLYHKEINKNGTVLEGYKVSDHPKGTNRSFLTKSMTMEEKRSAAIAYKEFLDNSKEFVDRSKKIPNHISKYKEKGYQVNKPGHKRKFFGKDTKEENLANAIAYLNSISHV